MENQKFNSLVNLKFKHLMILLLFSAFNRSEGQTYYYYNSEFYDNPVIFEAGASFGAMNCLTDIGGNKGLGSRFTKDVNIGQTKLNGGFYFSLSYKYILGLRFEGTLGTVGAADSVLKNIKDNASQTRYDRNLSFKSNILEASLIAEIYPTNILRNFDPTVSPPLTSPYILFGIGLFHFNPKTQYKGQWVSLQPLHLEGEGFSEYPDRPNYKLTQVNFPFGAGVKYEVSQNINIRMEFVYRLLKTDYLDDVSNKYIDPSLYKKYLTGKQLEEAMALNYRGSEIGRNHDHNEGAPRGYIKNNDSYFTINFKIGYIIGRKPIFGNNKGIVKCHK